MNKVFFKKKLALFPVKNANFFAECFGENILKIIASVPGGYIHMCAAYFFDFYVMCINLHYRRRYVDLIFPLNIL
jgi:hypothetical protein